MGECEYGIAAIAFSTMNSGSFICSVEQSKEAVLSMWDWEKKDLIGKADTNQSVTNGCVFHPFDNNLLITYGKNQLVFWNRRKNGHFERADVVKGNRTINCVAFLESGDIVAGEGKKDFDFYHQYINLNVKTFYCLK